MFTKSTGEKLPASHDNLPGRSLPMPIPETHEVLGTPLDLAGQGTTLAVFGLGCFWGAERLFWRMKGVRSTAVGYAAGSTPNPTYEEVCSGGTGHSEVVRVAFDEAVVSFENLLVAFWESHDPTQGMRQGNDVGTQYRSCILTTTEAHLAAAKASAERYEKQLTAAARGAVTTEIESLRVFYFAEGYHQQYLHKNPNGYCSLRGTGVHCM